MHDSNEAEESTEQIVPLSLSNVKQQLERDNSSP
jgi:hypothetical protein